jgi:hypothetical protein
MALRGRVGAFAMHAKHDPLATTTNARRAFRDSFERLVDPHSVLPLAERRRRAEAARRAHYARLARLSAIARRSARREDR